MSRIQTRILLVIAASCLAVGSSRAGAFDGPASATTKAAPDVTVSLCDGETEMSLPGLKPGEVLPPERAKEVAGQMLQSWRRSQGEARWAVWSRNAPAGTGGVLAQTPAAAAPP